MWDERHRGQQVHAWRAGYALDRRVETGQQRAQGGRLRWGHFIEVEHVTPRLDDQGSGGCALRRGMPDEPDFALEQVATWRWFDLAALLPADEAIVHDTLPAEFADH